MTEYPAQLKKIEAHVRRRLRSRIVSQQKRRRILFNRLMERGVSRRQAAKTAFNNDGRWVLSHKNDVEKAYPNEWFIKTLELKIASDKKLSHWRQVTEWIKAPNVQKSGNRCAARYLQIGVECLTIFECGRMVGNILKENTE